MGGCSVLAGGATDTARSAAETAGDAIAGESGSLITDPVFLLRVLSTVAIVAGAVFSIVGTITLSQGRKGSVQSIVTGMIVIGCGFAGHLAAHLIDQWLWWIVGGGLIVLIVSTYETWRDWPAVVRFLRWIGLKG